MRQFPLTLTAQVPLRAPFNGCSFSPGSPISPARARGAKQTTPDGPLQRLLGGALRLEELVMDPVSFGHKLKRRRRVLRHTGKAHPRAPDRVWQGTVQENWSSSV